MTRILLLSAYDAPSHRYWREGLARYFSDYSFTSLTLPPRHFSWRIRGNSLSWAWGAEREVLQQDYDLVIATSLVDLSSLRGFIPSLGRIPTLVYCHENQFAYPASSDQHHSVEPLMVNLYSALCADCLAFNSEWNRNSFFNGVADLLARLPDQVPSGLVDTLRERAIVLPVPLGDEWQEESVSTSDSVLDVVWNHRWEYDKGPELLLAVALASQAQGLPLRFHIVGQQFRQQPAAFVELQRWRERLPEGLKGCWGFVDERTDYRNLLLASDIVLSTAIHEFQGLAVMEGMAAGCTPLVPDRLSYPEFVDDACRYPSVPDSVEGEVEGVVARLADWCGRAPELPRPAQAAFDWPVYGPRYQAVFDALCKDLPRRG